ncbi:MAG: cysteine synthase family protein [Planctomycetota bacterium]
MACHLPDTNLHLGTWPPTPLTRVSLEPGAPGIWAKLEFMNPGGSTKDRIANHILTKAYRSGAVEPGGTVVESSSGSTSIAMAMVCAQLGLKFIAVMPAGVSNERSLIIKAYGGQVHHTDPDAAMADCITEARRLARERGAFLPRQFENPDNAEAHRFGTAREIVRQLPTQHVDAVVAGVGTGGTLVGLYHGMRDHGCHARPFHARPISAPGEPVAPGCFDHAECSSYSARIPGVVDNLSCLYQPGELEGLETIDIRDEIALRTTRRLIRLGLPCGPSSGLNYEAAVVAYQRLRERGIEEPTVVTVLCDRMERYFSTELFQDPVLEAEA